MATNNMSRPQFHNPSLQKAVENASPQIEGYLSSLDHISEDIRNLEKWLEASGVRAKAHAEVNEGRLGDHQIDVSSDQSELSSGEMRGTCVVEMIGWEPQKDKDRWRLMYTKIRRVYIFPQGSKLELGGDNVLCEDARDEVLEERPLIETSGETRRRAYKSLPMLVSSVAYIAEVKE